MSIQTKETLNYLIIYIAVILARFIFVFHGVGINPIMIHTSGDYYDYSILAFEKQFLMYLPLCFAISVLYIVIKKECLFETYLLYSLITVALFGYLLICLLFGFLLEVFYCAGMFLFMMFMIEHIKAEYKVVKLSDKLVKHNIFLVFLCLIGIIVLNVLYITVPKSKILIYQEANMSDDTDYFIREGYVEAIARVDIGEPDDSIYARGWVFQANQAGTEVITIVNDGLKKDYYNSGFKVDIDEHLRFHFKIDMEYIKLFYPFNLLVIAYCGIYIFLVFLKKYINWMK